MTTDPENMPTFVHRGRFLKVDSKKEIPEQRDFPDRRQSLRGDPSKSETGKERRVGSRRLEDMIIKIEIKDPKSVYINESTLIKTVTKKLTLEFKPICEKSGVTSLLNFIERPKALIVETKLKYRDKIKQFAADRGLSFEVVDEGVFTDNGSDKLGNKSAVVVDKDGPKVSPETSELSTIMGFSPEKLNHETDKLVFKVFVKCLNEVHTVSRDHERDAMKQNVSSEQRIIYIASKYYPNSKKITLKTIIDQVFSDTIKEYNKMIQLEAELTKMEERMHLSGDQRLKPVIQTKKDELNDMWASTLDQTIRILYLYLDYFKDIIKVGATRERIENIYNRVNEKQIEVLNLKHIFKQVKQVLEAEEKVNQGATEKKQEYLGYFKWLKNELTNEVYFTRNLWINNMKGKAFIDEAIGRTLKAIGK